MTDGRPDGDGSEREAARPRFGTPPGARAVMVGLGLWLGGCGASAAVVESPSVAECEASRDHAGRLWGALADRSAAEAVPSGDGAALSLEATLERLETHLASLREQPHAVDGDEALALSSAIMDGMDAVSDGIPEALRERADHAAEALLTDRGAGSIQATEGAIAVVEQVVASVRPEAVPARARRRALTEVSRRARAASLAYEDDVAAGDRRADRAEAAPVPDDASGLRADRDAATRASAEARRACGVERTLSVPR